MPKRKTVRKKTTTKRKRTTKKKTQGGFLPIAPLLAGLAGSLLPGLLGRGRGLMLPGTRR